MIFRNNNIESPDESVNLFENAPSLTKAALTVWDSFFHLITFLVSDWSNQFFQKYTKKSLKDIRNEFNAMEKYYTTKALFLEKALAERREFYFSDDESRLLFFLIFSHFISDSGVSQVFQ